MTAIAQAPTRNGSGIRMLLWTLIVAGFALALFLGQSGFFEAVPGDSVASTVFGAVGPFALTITLPPVLFLLAYRAIPAFHAFVLAADPRFVTMTQAWRIVGFYFLALLGITGREGITPQQPGLHVVRIAGQATAEGTRGFDMFSEHIEHAGRE